MMTSARRLATDVVGHSAGSARVSRGTLGYAANHSTIRVLWHDPMNDCGSNPTLSRAG
jgi:hypothetical protein